MGETAISPIQLSEVTHLSLHDLNVELDLREQSWLKKAQAILIGTGIDLPRWKAIASDLLDGKQPALREDEQRSLVSKGILQVQITFAGEK